MDPCAVRPLQHRPQQLDRFRTHVFVFVSRDAEKLQKYVKLCAKKGTSTGNQARFSTSPRKDIVQRNAWVHHPRLDCLRDLAPSEPC